MNIDSTLRGFGRSEFKDANGHTCSIQDSSAVPKLWLGVDDVEVMDYAGTPRVIDIAKLGDNVKALGRMHLTMEMVRDLLPALARFATTGTIFPQDITRSDVRDCTGHSQWPAWLAYYTARYGAVETKDGEPIALMARASWEAWCAAREALPSWHAFNKERPEDMTTILWRTEHRDTDAMGIGVYRDSDECQWKGEWLSVAELHAFMSEAV